MRNSHNYTLLLFITLILVPKLTTGRPFVLVLTQDDLKDAESQPPSDETDSPFPETDFPDADSRSDDELEPGSWRPLFEPDSSSTKPSQQPDPITEEYYASIETMMTAMSEGEPRLMDEAADEIEAAASTGYPHAQSVMGFLYGMGITRERSGGKAFMYHHFAAEGGNMHSKLALAYTYLRQDVCTIS